MRDEVLPGLPDFDALYRQYRHLLLNVATSKFRLPVEEAEALMHDVFLSAMVRWGAIRDVRQWMIGAICNACRHRLRQLAKREPLDDDIAERGEEPPYVTRIAAQAILERVNANDRAVMILRFQDGMTAREMGRALGCTARAADRRLRRALQRAAKCCDGRDTLPVHEHRP